MAKKEISWILRARDNVTTVLARVGKRFRAFAQAGIQMAKRLAVGLIVIGAAATAMGVRAVAAYNRKQAAASKLTSVLRATGYAAGFTTTQLRNQARALQRQTGIADDTIMSMQGILATFKQIRGDEFRDATEAILDMSVVMARAGQDTASVESAAIQVGKALNDPIRGMAALNRVGIQFNDQQREQIRLMQQSGNVVGAQRVIIAELQAQFGGAARGIDENVKGYRVLRATLGDFQAAVGEALTENLALAEVFEAITKRLEDLSGSGYIDLWAERLASGIREVMKLIGPLLQGLGAVRDFVSDAAGMVSVMSTRSDVTVQQAVRMAREMRAVDEKAAASRLQEIREERAERARLRAESESSEMAAADSQRFSSAGHDLQEVIDDMEHRIRLQKLLNKGQLDEAEILRVQARLNRELTADEESRLRERVEQLRMLEAGVEAVQRAGQRDTGTALARIGGMIGTAMNRAEREGLKLDTRRNQILTRMQTSLQRMENNLTDTRMT